MACLISSVFIQSGSAASSNCPPSLKNRNQRCSSVSIRSTANFSSSNNRMPPGSPRLRPSRSRSLYSWAYSAWPGSKLSANSQML